MTTSLGFGSLGTRAVPYAVLIVSGVLFWVWVAFAQSGAALTDPAEILTRGAQATAEAESFHLTITLGGSVTEPESGMEVPLDGVTVEGDFDITDQAAHLTFSFPSLLGLTGEAIVISEDMYLKTSMTGEKWVHMPATAGEEPMSEPPTAEEIADSVAELLATEGVLVEKLDDTACGDDTCYQVRLTIPVEALAGHEGDIGDIGGMNPADVFSGPLVMDMLFEHGDLWLRGFSTDVTAEGAGEIAFTVTLSDYNAPLEISAPPADEVTEEGEFPLFPN